MKNFSTFVRKISGTTTDRKYRFLADLYHTEEISDRALERLTKRIDRNAFFTNPTIICLSELDGDELDIIKYRKISSFSYSDEISVVGIARDEDDALEVISLIASDIYKKTGGCSMKTYFTDHALWQSFS